jgi:glycosyltransferase involved in cell wall biosynthesis
VSDHAGHRVVVDARSLQIPLTGVGRYVERLLAGLPAGLIGVARPSWPVEPHGLSVHQLRPDAWNVIWNELRLSPFLRDADAYWTPSGYVPWTRPKRCTVVSTIHDVMHHTNRQGLSLQRRLDLENSVHASVRRADVLSTTCQFVSDELAQHYGRHADLIVPPAPTVAQATSAATTAMRDRLAAACPDVTRWVLAVGQEIERKNMVRIADAVATLPGVGLVVAGPHTDPAVGAALDARARAAPLVRLGYTTGDELAAAYAVADVLAFVSLQEGYGMPLLDARSLGLRLVVSDIAPLPAHAGASAVVVDGLSVDAIASGLRRSLDNPPPAPETLPSWSDGARQLGAALGLPVA